MRFRKGRMIFLTLTVFAVLANSWAYELKLFQGTFRHGNRAPKTEVYQKDYPNSPYVNYTWYPEGPAGLTLEGKRVEYQLGKWLRNRYNNFIGDTWTRDLMNLRTDDAERSTMSAQLVVAGLFPPSLKQVWDDSLAWQPIPYTYLPADEDYLFNGQMNCNNEHTNKLKKTDEKILAHQASLVDFFANISRNTGAYASWLECYNVYAQLRAEVSEGLPLADWATEEWVGYENGNLYNVTAYNFVQASWDNQGKSFNGGQWIKEFLVNVDAYINGTSKKKVHLYSGHEGHVAAILIALNLFELHIPYFGSIAIFELYAEDGEYYVKFVHKDKDTVKDLVIPGCRCVYCPLTTFRNLFANIMLEDVETACAVAQTFPSKK